MGHMYAIHLLDNSHGSHFPSKWVDMNNLIVGIIGINFVHWIKILQLLTRRDLFYSILTSFHV